MDWLNRLKDQISKIPPSVPKPEPQVREQLFANDAFGNVRTVSTTQLGELVGIHLPSQLLKDLGMQPFAQTKNGCFWAVEDIPIIFLKMSKHFADKAKEELNRT